MPQALLMAEKCILLPTSILLDSDLNRETFTSLNNKQAT